MITTLVTFENKKKTEKVEVSVKWKRDDSMNVDVVFTPLLQVNEKYKKHHLLALLFVKQISGEDHS